MKLKMMLLAILTLVACTSSPPIIRVTGVPCDKIDLELLSFAYGGDEVDDRAADPTNDFDTPETVKNLIHFRDGIVAPACPAR